MFESPETTEGLEVTIALPVERGSGKIRNTASYRIKEALSVVMVGSMLGLVVGLPLAGVLSIVKPELGVWNLIPVAMSVGIGASLALVAELRYQSRSS